MGKLVAISLLLVLLAAINMFNPMVQRYFIDNALATGQGTMRDLWLFIGLTFVLTVGGMICWIYRYWLCVKLGASLSMSLRSKLYYKIQVLSLSFINNRKPGELMNRVSRDTKQIRIFMEEVFGDMFSTLVTMIVSLVMMLIISWKMTILSLIFVVAVLVIIRMFWHHIHTIFISSGCGRMISAAICRIFSPACVLSNPLEKRSGKAPDLRRKQRLLPPYRKKMSLSGQFSFPL